MPGMNPIGHQLGDKFRRTIVGVVKDSKYTRVDEGPMPMAYYPYTQVNGVRHLEVEVRVKGTATALLPSIERAVHTIDTNLPLENPMTQQAVFEESYSSSHSGLELIPIGSHSRKRTSFTSCQSSLLLISDRV